LALPSSTADIHRRDAENAEPLNLKEHLNRQGAKIAKFFKEKTKKHPSPSG
jgi:hypothetical protein